MQGFAPFLDKIYQYFLSFFLTFLLLRSISTEVVNPEECAQLLRRIANSPSLPPQYWLTLHCLLRHFARVCHSGPKNLLTARALGEIFSPVFFRHQAARWVSQLPSLSRNHASLRRGPAFHRYADRRQTQAYTLNHTQLRHTASHTHLSWIQAGTVPLNQLYHAFKAVEPEFPPV